MTGEQLYALYAQGNARQNCEVDSWEELPKEDREVWRWMAGEVTARTHPPGRPAVL